MLCVLQAMWLDPVEFFALSSCENLLMNLSSESNLGRALMHGLNLFKCLPCSLWLLAYDVSRQALGMEREGWESREKAQRSATGRTGPSPRSVLAAEHHRLPAALPAAAVLGKAASGTAQTCSGMLFVPVRFESW